MLEIFSDSKLRCPVNDLILDENISYYLRLKVHDPAAIKKELATGQCALFLDWHPNNPVGCITFKDVVGFANLFGKSFHVRSTKFLTEKSGSDQYAYLLKDISAYSSTLVFSPAAPTSYHYDIDPQKITSNVFYIYKYLSSKLLHDGRDSLQYLLELILANPNFIQRTMPAYVPTFSTRKFNYSTLQHVAEKSLASDLIRPDHELYKKPFINKLPSTENGTKLIPKYLFSVSNTISYDTPENRFLKYFLLWCQEIYLNILRRYNYVYQISEDCERSLKVIKKYLYHPFFRDIGTFSFLPINSSVLANRHGYKEIFLHYLRGRSRPKIFDKYLSDMFDTLGIKNISKLYEYWVYFRIAKELYGAEATLEVIDPQFERSNLKYGLRISNESSSLYFNKVYKHSPFDSYNFNLRPDISLEIDKAGHLHRYFFDAKYSNTSIPSADDDPVAVYKNMNIVKMLSYLEAINNADFAVIVYPGTQFGFYSKTFKSNNNFESDPAQLTDLKGVGALPLSPENRASNELFKTFMRYFKSKILSCS